MEDKKETLIKIILTWLSDGIVLQKSYYQIFKTARKLAV